MKGGGSALIGKRCFDTLFWDLDAQEKDVYLQKTWLCAYTLWKEMREYFSDGDFQWESLFWNAFEILTLISFAAHTFAETWLGKI